MPIKNVRDAIEVREHIKEVFAAAQPDERAQAIRRLFVNVLDFEDQRGQVALASTPAGVKLPPSAERIAALDGVHVCYIALDTSDTDRVRKQEAVAAARQVANELGDDLLLIFTNTSRSQLHFVHPLFETSQPTLRRMVVERDLPHRTAIQQIANIYSKYDESGSIRAALETAFDVEPVTKSFFAEYKRIFEAAEQLVHGFNTDADDEDEARDEIEARRMFVQTLFNRLLFVHFLSRKGWLKFGDNTDYINALWENYQATPHQTSFYQDRLYHLFFFGLNNPQSSDLNFKGSFMSSVFGDVPFLNGGLFEKNKLDRRDDVIVSDSAIEPVLSELFDKFNFTVMESTPFDIEVAVDPEMLGKVFEELVTGRHESGAYYTPRPIVAFMCREALKGHLESRNVGLSSEAIQRFVDERDTTEISLNAAPKISRALDEITVVDPACGSGAYLLGMLQELTDLQTALYNVRTDSRSLYELKLHVIERNLYGVDIDPFAVNIAMLRLWLSLAIEYEGEKPKPLPNLDFKIVCGDGLLGPDPNPALQGELFTERIRASNLGRLKAEYMRESDGNDKSAKKMKIESVQDKLRQELGEVAVADSVVDWRIAFAEVFAMGGGFDVVVANPPYIRHENLSEYKPDLARLYPRVYTGTADILVYFYARAIELMRSGASLVFITSNSFTKRAYAKKLRRYLADALTITTTIDFGEIKVFNATVEVFVLAARNLPPEPEAIVNGHNLYPLLARRLGRGGSVEEAREELRRLPDDLATEVSVFPQARLGESEWRIEDEEINSLFERLISRRTSLGKFMDGRIYRGVITGLNEAFVINQADRDSLVAADPRSTEIIKPWLRGRDIKRWTPEWAGKYLIKLQNSGDASAANPWVTASTEAEARRVFAATYPAIHDHMASHQHRLRPRLDQGRYWWELRACAYYAEFERPKIIWPDIARDLRFAFDPNGSYLGNTTYVMPINSMWLMAFMNSDLAEFLLCQITNALRGGFLRLFTQYTTRLPIETPTPAHRNRLESIGHAGIAGESVDTDELNDTVYNLYGLSRSDINLINDWFERRSLIR